MYLYVMSTIEKNMDKIRKLCVSHYVDHLYVFGAILTSKFNRNSDIDMGVNISGVNLVDYVGNYFNFKFGLEEILERKLICWRIMPLKIRFLENLLIPQSK